MNGGGLNMGDRQKTTIAAALTALSVAALVVMVGGCFWMVGAFFGRFAAVFTPLATAAVLALVVRPYFDWLCRICRGAKGLALVTLFVSTLAPLVAFLWFFGAMALGQLADLLAALPGWMDTLKLRLAEQAPAIEAAWVEHDVGEKLRNMLQTRWEDILNAVLVMGEGAASASLGVFRAIAGMLGWVVFPVYLVFFLLASPMSGKNLGDLLPFLKKNTRHDVVFLAEEFLTIMVSFFRGQLVIALLQGLLFAIGFQLVGLQYGFVLGLVLGIMNIVPYLGSMLGLAVTLPLSFFQEGGGPTTTVLVLGVFGLVQLIEGYILTPRIMGDRTGLHPLVIIVAIFFWGAALDGILGMILAIPLTAFLVVFWRLAKRRYIKEIL